MKSTRLASFVFCCPLLFATGAAQASRAGLKGGYLDLLGAEAVGEFRGQKYDAYRMRDNQEVFVGNQQLAKQTLLAGGLGLRVVLVAGCGLRFSGEGSLQGGRLLGDNKSALAESVVLRGELLGGIGYQHNLGPFVLHAAGIFGGDYASLKVAPQPAGVSALSLPTGASSAVGDDLTLRRWGLRLGAQLGAHLQVSKLAALYGDVTFDYDGQWRSRLGIAIGEPGRR